MIIYVRFCNKPANSGKYERHFSVVIFQILVKIASVSEDKTGCCVWRRGGSSSWSHGDVMEGCHGSLISSLHIVGGWFEVIGLELDNVYGMFHGTSFFLIFLLAKVETRATELVTNFPLKILKYVSLFTNYPLKFLKRILFILRRRRDLVVESLNFAG